MTANVDIEASNCCNASCRFCPRNAMSHQGLMSPETFDQSLARAIELRSIARSLRRPGFRIGFCGLGEPLLNRHLPAFVRQVREAGFACAVSSNGALLDERKAHALLDAGLQRIEFNIADVGDAYERTYGLPFERTRDNILRFNELAGGACEIRIALTDYRYDPEHLERMRRFWCDHGIPIFITFELNNRGGALVVDHMQYETYPEVAEARDLLAEADIEPICATPFAYLFIGYDGRYYLDSLDYTKQVPLGNVFDDSFTDIMAAKLAHIRTREPICKSCSLDPTNLVADSLRRCGSPDAPEVRETIEKVRGMSAAAAEEIAALSGSGDPGPMRAQDGNRVDSRSPAAVPPGTRVP